MNIDSIFETGTICTVDGAVNAQKIEFTPHAKFKGVSIKHLVTGKTTNNRISCHLVKVEAGCTLDTHVHEKNLEIHEVIRGDGTLILADKTFTYSTGSIGVIPVNVVHKVEAGKNGLCILAKFSPALF
jgi:quercetin dioxygenase-like cupin family protein